MASRQTNKRRKNRRAPRFDALFGFLIPMAFIVLAGYQEVHDGQVDKYVVGALLIFGLGALGWRVDTLLEKYLDMRNNGGSLDESTDDEDAS